MAHTPIDPGLTQAISLAKAAVTSGDAIRYRTTGNMLDVETDSGWQQWWPHDPAPDFED